MAFKFIRTISRDHKLEVIINNPPVNIMTGAVMEELIQVLSDARADKHLRVVLLKGEGKAWSAGADVAEHLPESFEAMLVVFGKLCELIRSYPIPTVAAVNGLCLGGGCEVAAMCDFIVASEKAKFGQPEIKVGVFPPAALAHFPRKYGLGKALEIILTGDVFDAAKAYQLGLVTKVVPVETFEDEVEDFVSKLSCNSRVVLMYAKQAAQKSLCLSPEYAAQKVEDIYRRSLMKTQDAVEGLTAFLDKRPPEWKDE